jgi:nitrite reductase/ring-hydroxylating ferredoxin subunit
MASPPVATSLAGFFRAASLADLEEKQMTTVHGADRPVLLCWHEGQVFALDNRCPHMGFPLGKGSLDHETVLGSRCGILQDASMEKAMARSG